jgi:hypothetical protein
MLWLICKSRKMILPASHGPDVRARRACAPSPHVPAPSSAAPQWSRACAAACICQKDINFAQNLFFSFLSFGCESRRSLVWLAVQLVVAHAEMQDALVDAQTGSVEDKVGRLFVDRLDHKLLVIERDVPNLAPGESDLGRQPFQCNRTNGKSQLVL